MSTTITLRGALVLGGLAFASITFAQGKYGATVEDSVQCVQSLSLYQEFMKQKAYGDALPNWRKAMTICPASSKKMYLDGVKLRAWQIASTKDEALKAALYDSLYMVYDQRIANYGQREYVLGRKGVDMLKNTPDRTEDVFNTLKESVTGRGAKSEAGVLAAYYQAMYNMYQAQLVSKEQMLEEYLLVMGHIESNLTSTGSGEEGEEGGETGGNLYLQARDIVNDLFFRVADCTDIGGIVKKLTSERPDDMELKVRLLNVMNAKDCSEEAVFLPLAEDVHRANPTSESAYSLFLAKLKKGDNSGALNYIKEAVDLCKGCSDRTKYLLRAGQMASNIGNHAQARSYANQVLQAESKNGEAMMLIARSIFASSSSCSEPDSWGPIWLAYDYYQRAKSLDPSVADKAQAGMNSCADRFPDKAKAFFHQLNAGQSFQVTCGGWNESTTVRVR